MKSLDFCQEDIDFLVGVVVALTGAPVRLPVESRSMKLRRQSTRNAATIESHEIASNSRSLSRWLAFYGRLIATFAAALVSRCHSRHAAFTD